MKKLLITAVLSATWFFAYAQPARQDADRFSFTATAATAIPMSKPSCTPFELQFTAHYNITQRFSAGAGTGISFYEKTLIPVFGDLRYQIGRIRRLTPFAEVGAGYSIAVGSNTNGGFYLNPSLGICYPLGERMRLQFSLGYELQEMERLKKHSDAHFSAAFAEKLSNHSVSVRLGLRF